MTLSVSPRHKMSAKSSIKLLVPNNQPGTLYKWVAI
jgi:hypothetical protein